jgi:hypothetical protein
MDETPMDVQKALRNVMQQLQREPRRYRLFGIYWWPIKAQLKQAGYGLEQLFMLGSYQDADTAALVPAMGLTATLRTAFEEYGRNASYPHPDRRVETPDGDLVTVLDEDAGGL